MEKSNKRNKSNSIGKVIQMTSRVQTALTAAAVASSGKMPSLIRKQRHGSPTAGIFTRSQQKRSFSSVYSVRPGNNGTTSDTSCASYTDRLQVQKMLVVFLTLIYAWRSYGSYK
ncbi:hypothetical protein QQG55_32320 [Brugia pahangi]